MDVQEQAMKITSLFLEVFQASHSRWITRCFFYRFLLINLMRFLMKAICELSYIHLLLNTELRFRIECQFLWEELIGFAQVSLWRISFSFKHFRLNWISVNPGNRNETPSLMLLEFSPTMSVHLTTEFECNYLLGSIALRFPEINLKFI